MLTEARTSALAGAVVQQSAQEEVQVLQEQAMALAGGVPTWQTLEPDTTDDHLD